MALLPCKPQDPAIAQQFALCIIARNEERNLAACLESAAGLAAEIIVVDTGSTDGTREIARRFGARVIDFPWCDDFAAARNECLRHATAPWIFWLDADDRLDDTNRRRLADLRASLTPQPTGFIMSCVSLVDPGTGASNRVDQVRLFPNHPALRWRGRVHEQILPAHLALGGNVQPTNIEIRHLGYQDPAVLRQKLERNLRLLERDLLDRPDDPDLLFNLGWSRLQSGDAPCGIRLLERTVTEGRAAAAQIRKAFALLTVAAREASRRDDALAWCRRGLASFPDDAELQFQEARLLFESGRPAEAAERLEKLLAGPPPRYLAYGVEDGLRAYRARFNLGVIYRDQKRFAEAEAQWRQALAEQPAYDPPRLALAELLVVQERWQEVEAFTPALRRNPAHALDADILHARICLGRGQARRSRKILERAVACHPTAVRPRVLLARLLDQQGIDPAAAVKVLRSILDLEPGHPEAFARLQALAARP